MPKTPLSLSQVHELVSRVLLRYGCNGDNAESIAVTITAAERDGSESHGLFRLPGYVASLRSGKVNGDAVPFLRKKTEAVLEVDANNGFAPNALRVGLPQLVIAAESIGIAVMSLRNTYHFSALWPETEFLAERGLVGIACTNYVPTVAPVGGVEKFFGTNPLSFSWPRKNKSPVCFDMATSAMSLGDVQIAARDGKTLPKGVGLDAHFQDTFDPKGILEGVLLPFGGYKGSLISMMVELLSAGLTGDVFSYEAKECDNGDGGPVIGAELVIAINPSVIASGDWQQHSEEFFNKLSAIEGVRLPGLRRHRFRENRKMIEVDTVLLETINNLL